MRAEHEGPHVAHGTGNRRLDLTLALSAMFVSLVSLAIAIHHGHAMDRLVEANSWPFLSANTGNLDDQGRRRIWLSIGNAGIGPARLETFELWWRDQPIPTAVDLLQRCCIRDSGIRLDPPALHAMHMTISTVAPAVLRAGDDLTFLSLERTDDNAHVWDRLDMERLQITMRACYCSVFDECWQADLRHTTAKDVRRCPAVKVPFNVPLQWFGSAARTSGNETDGH
jgi:hypothetical protein